MTNNCEILVVYQQQPKIMIYKDNLFAIKDYDNLRQNIINKSSKQKSEIKKIAVKSGDKFILELEEKLPGITCIFNPETFNFVQSKALENNVQKIKVHIIKVDKYPDWKPPQILKILEKTLKSAYDEVIKEIKTDLTPVNLENGGRVFKKERKEEKEMSNETYNDCHVGIYCNNCHSGNFFGLRYICAECNNYNLCESCYSTEIYTHCQDHTFIRVKDPIVMNINNYSCIFSPNRKLETRDFQPFDVEFEVINNGTFDLDGCIISPIRFGKQYLGCTKRTITDKCGKGEKTKIKILITFEDDITDNDFQPLEQYEGYYRLITKQGIPFGDIFYLQVNIKN